MLSIFQRLLLGSLLLLALITGLSFLVRGTFVALSGLAEEQKRMNTAVGALAAAQASLLREQILVERSLLHLPEPAQAAAQATGKSVPSPAAPFLAKSGSGGPLSAAAGAQAAPPENEIHAQSERAQGRLEAAQTALGDIAADATDAAQGAQGSGSGRETLDGELRDHRRVLERLHHVQPDFADRMRSARELEPIGISLGRKLQVLEDRRRDVRNDLDLRRGALRGRLISACGASVVTGVVLAAAMLFFTMRPLRRAANAARRTGQGDLQQRIDWPLSDELGTVATEFNRLAIRLRDLRETETGRREMEYQLSDAVVQSIFEPVIVTDGRGQILKTNNAARELLGEAPDRMALTSTPGGDKILAAIGTAISLQRTVVGESEAAMAPLRLGAVQRDNEAKSHEAKSHEARSYRLRTTPMRDGEGHLLGAVTVLEDVTELQELDRFKTRFLAVASGKLRDPLEKLRIAIHALARGYAGDLRPLQADVMEGAQNEAQHLDDLMTDLFSVAELDSGHRALKLEQFRPLDVLREAQATVRGAAAEKDLSVEVEAYADLQRIVADRRALRSIFENLLSNAVRNTERGGAIRLTATESKGVVHFAVSDTGRGIEAERLNMIFGRFNSGSGEGTGLGLALVRRLVEAQGGQISVESRVGAGTTFLFTLPAAPALAPRHPVEAG